jgi:hypothetical protein
VRCEHHQKFHLPAPVSLQWFVGWGMP